LPREPGLEVDVDLDGVDLGQLGDDAAHGRPFGIGRQRVLHARVDDEQAARRMAQCMKIDRDRLRFVF
jgi:hypothetical protein